MAQGLLSTSTTGDIRSSRVPACQLPPLSLIRTASHPTRSSNSSNALSKPIIKTSTPESNSYNGHQTHHTLPYLQRKTRALPYPLGGIAAAVAGLETSKAATRANNNGPSLYVPSGFCPAMLRLCQVVKQSGQHGGPDRSLEMARTPRCSAPSIQQIQCSERTHQHANKGSAPQAVRSQARGPSPTPRCEIGGRVYLRHIFGTQLDGAAAPTNFESLTSNAESRVSTVRTVWSLKYFKFGVSPVLNWK
jgi:hypothetical protein